MTASATKESANERCTLSPKFLPGGSYAGMLLLAANIAYWMLAGAYTPFLSAYFTAIGLSATQTGALLTIQPLAVIFIQPLWARLSDRTGKRKLVLSFLVAASAVSVLLYYLGIRFATVLFATVVFSLFFSALLPLCDALVIDGCSTHGVEFARVRMGGTLGYAFVVFVAGSFLDVNPSAQFALVAVLCVIFLITVFLLPVARSFEMGAQNAVQDDDSNDMSDEPDKHSVLGIFTTSEIYYVLAFAFVSQMGLGFSGSFLGRYVVELGFGQGLVGVLSAVSALSEVPILLFAGPIVRRFGEMRLLIASCFFMVLRIVLIGVGVVPTMVIGQLMQSVTYMTVYYSCTRYVASHVLPGRQSQGQSVLVMVQSGMAMLMANLAGGVIGDAFGMQMFFYLSALLVLMGTVGVFLAYRARGRHRQGISAVGHMQ